MKRIVYIFFPLMVVFTFISAKNGKNISFNLNQSAIELKEVTPFIYCSIRHKGPYSDIETIIRQLMMASRNQNIFPAGPLIGVYYNTPDQVKPANLEWEIGFPITPQVLPQPPLEKKQWNFTLVVSTVHVGPYEKTGETIAKMQEWMKANNLAPSGPLLERYLTMPTPETKPENLKTEIWIPCQKQNN